MRVVIVEDSSGRLTLMLARMRPFEGEVSHQQDGAPLGFRRGNGSRLRRAARRASGLRARRRADRKDARSRDGPARRREPAAGAGHGRRDGHRRRIFVPMLRVTTIDPGAVTLSTGSVSLRRFRQRPHEVLVVGQLIDAPVRLVDTGVDAVVVDAACRAHPLPGLGRRQAGGARAPRQARAARAGAGRGLERGHRARADRPAGHGRAAVRAGDDAPRRRRRDAGRAAGEAPPRGGRRLGRRAAGRRLRGDVRGRPARPARAPRRRPRRGRAGGDVDPTTRPTC